MITAGMNGELGNTSHKWACLVGRCTDCLSSGVAKDAERTLPIYMFAPRDPLIDKTPFWKTEIYQILGEVGKRLFSLGYRRHGFDKMLFLKFGPRVSPEHHLSDHGLRRRLLGAS